MGFNGAAKKEAAAQQAQAYAAQQAAYAKAQADAAAYQSTSATRNAGVIGIRDYANSFLDKFHKGTDISQLIPSYLKVGQQASDTVKNTMTQASRMGDSSQLPTDQGYQQKLNSVTTSNLGRNLAAINEGVLSDEVSNQTGNSFNATNFLNADAQVGLNQDTNLFGMTDTIWHNATTRREMEIQVAQQAMGNLMGWVSMGLGAATGFLGPAKSTGHSTPTGGMSKGMAGNGYTAPPSRVAGFKGGFH